MIGVKVLVVMMLEEFPVAEGSGKIDMHSLVKYVLPEGSLNILYGGPKESDDSGRIC